MTYISIFANIRYAKNRIIWSNNDFYLWSRCAKFANMNMIYANIKAIRMAKGLTQEDVADKLGLATSNYGRVERGLTELSIDRLEKIAEIFEVSVNYLLHFHEKNQIDFKEDAEYYYNLSKKLESKLEKLKKEQLEAEDSETWLYTNKLNEIEALKQKVKGLNEKIKLLEKIIEEKDSAIEDKNKTIAILERAMDLISKGGAN